MANFKDWALQYVLADDEPAQLDIAKKAAKEIEDSGANRVVVGNWAASVQSWMSRAQASDDDQMDDGDDGGSGDIIARAKALGFLAGTLESLDKDVLREDQVTFLVGFFGAMFSLDHKSGITASTKALRRLLLMKAFKPSLGAKMVEDVLNLKEDFRLQPAATRLEIYDLLFSLFQEKSVNSELQHKYGPSCGFAVDLLQLCQHERDPRNLMVWFKILKTLLADYSPSAEVTEEIFKAFSAYFPISLRSSATPIGITADDLKEAVRGCFAAHQRLSSLAFPFLMQKLDQGDAVTVSVKVDILRTLKACVQNYNNPQASVVPHIEKIWNSLKYEVRNGEVKETIDATLDVLRAIADRLDGSKTQKLDVLSLKDYIDLVFGDCRDDLANPTYTKQAGLLVMTVVTSNIRSYILENVGLVECIRQNLKLPKSPSHTKDLLLILNSILKSRSDLVNNRKAGHPQDEEQLKGEPKEHLESLFHDTYLRIWTSTSNEVADSVDIPEQLLQGMALLASQRAVGETGEDYLLCSAKICSEICTLLIQHLVKGLTLSSNDNMSDGDSLEEEAQIALRTVASVYTPAYDEFILRATAEIRKRDWTNPSKYSLDALRNLLFHLAYVGCSEIPAKIVSDALLPHPFSPLQHLTSFTTAMVSLFPLSPSTNEADTQEESLANSYVIAALHTGLLFFRDACVTKYKLDTLDTYSKADENWLEGLEHVLDDWLQGLSSAKAGITSESLGEDDPEVYRQFLCLGLLITRYLYRAAVSGPQSLWNADILFKLSNIAATTVRSLGEQLQKSCNLAIEAFNFFGSEGPARPQTEILTRGILEGLWPGAMTELYKPGGVAERFLCRVPESTGSYPRQGEVRASIGLILANKYRGGAFTFDTESQTIKTIISYWEDQLKLVGISTDVKPDDYQGICMVGMKTISGAAARLDKAVLDMAPLLKDVLGSENPNGDILARSMGILVQDTDLLTTENHAVVRRFYKQWIYTHLAKPLYPLALPTAGDRSSTESRYRSAILSIVSNCVYGVYEADLEPLIRLLVITLGDRSSLAAKAGRQQLVSALEVLVEILANEPDTLKSHLKAIIGGVMAVYEGCLPDRQEAKKDASLTAARKLVLQTLGAIPKKFEERHLLPYSLRLQRMLALTCGDPVREVRQVARLARVNWAKVVV